MKYLLLASLLLLSACSAPVTSSSEEYEIRPATAGVVDHNVIPKK